MRRGGGTVDAVTDTSEADARRSMLLGVKLRALVAEHTGGEQVADPVVFAPGSALLHDGAAWVLLDDQPERRLGAALAWSIRNGATSLNIVSESGTGLIARRAEAFELPVGVWYADERTLLPVVAEPLAESEPATADHEAFRDRIIEGGADPLVEHGVLFGEVRGLEVCRVVDDVALGTTRLEVGVGAHDREAFQMLHGDVPTVESLARIADDVRRHRDVDAAQHPLNRLAAERFLRWRIEQDPSLVGADVVVPAPPPVPRPNLKDPTPCVAHAVAGDEVAATIVVSSGVELDLVPYAADARLATEARSSVGSDHRLVIALPKRDRMRVIDEIADCLRRPVEFVTFD